MRIAVVSDIHSNLVALQAVLADAGRVDKTWCLGDLVGYGPQPNECISFLREREPNLLCIAGNHDWGALGKMDVSAFNADAETAALWTREQLTPDNRDYLDKLPESIVDGEFTLVHGSPRLPIWEYLVSEHVARDNFPLLKTRYCLVGHSHMPVIFIEGKTPDDLPEMDWPSPSVAVPLGARRLFINPGSVGQPRDGNRDASYLLLDTDAMTFTYQRVQYRIADTQRLMGKVGLPERLIVRLGYGL